MHIEYCKQLIFEVIIFYYDLKYNFKIQQIHIKGKVQIYTNQLILKDRLFDALNNANFQTFINSIKQCDNKFAIHLYTLRNVSLKIHCPEYISISHKI